MYESVALNLSQAQLKNLMNGKSVNISASRVGSGHSITLASRKVQKIKRNASLNKGTRISLSGPEMEQNTTQGGSIFSDLLKRGKDNLVDKFGDVAVNLATNKGKDYLNTAAVLGQAYAPNFGNFLPDSIGKSANSWYDDGIHLGNNFAQDNLKSLLSGLLKTVKGKGIMRELHGSGFLDSVLGSVDSFVAPMANNLANVGSQIAGDMLMKKMMGGKVHSKKTGAGLFDFVSDIPVVGNIAKPLVGVANGVVGNVAEKMLADMLTKSLTGKGVKRGRGRPRKTFASGIKPPGY